MSIPNIMLNNKRKIFWIVSLLFIVLIAFILIPRKVTLLLSVTPIDSQVYIDNKQTSATTEIKLKKGRHQIKISKAGYIEINKEVDIKSNLSLNFQLVSDKIADLNHTKDLLSSFTPETNGDYFVAKDRNSSSLKLLDSKMNLTDTISVPNDTIRNFVAGSSKILILSTSNKYYIYNINDKTVSEIDLSQYDPITSLSINKDDNLLVSGKYSVTSNTSDVYIHNTITGASTLVKSNIFANFVIPLLDKKILSIKTEDSANSTTASVLDLLTGVSKDVVRKPDYLDNPVVNLFSQKFAYTGVNGLTSYNYESNTKITLTKDMSEEVIYSWINEDDLLVADIINNKMFIINTTTLFVSEKIDLPKFNDKKLIKLVRNEKGLVYFYKNLQNNSISVFRASID